MMDLELIARRLRDLRVRAIHSAVQSRQQAIAEVTAPKERAPESTRERTNPPRRPETA